MSARKPKQSVHGILPGLPSSNSRVSLGGLVQGVADDLDIEGAGLGKVIKRYSNTALDHALLAQQPTQTCGRRIPLTKTSAKAKDFERVAKQPKGPSKFDADCGYPSDDDLLPLCHYRFGKLENFALGDWKPGRVTTDLKFAEALGICHHPTPTGIAAAYQVLWRNRFRLGPNSKACDYAWRRDLIALDKSLGDRSLIATADFEKLYPELIAAKGVNGAVLFVLEQACEFERTCDYVAGHLKLFRETVWTKPKGLHLADLEPILMFAQDFGINGVISGDPKNHAELAFRFLKRFRPPRNRASAPEGERFHSIMGLSPLEYLLFYFFSCNNRFVQYSEPKASNDFTLESALFRLALNVLAHIDYDEAHAEFAARLSQTKITKVEKDRRAKSERASICGLHSNFPETAFDLFNEWQAGPLRQVYENPNWAGDWVLKLRESYDEMVQRGLHHELLNPLARAFPMPEAWSQARSLVALDHWFAVLVDEVSALDPLYSPLTGTVPKAPSTMKPWESKISLKLALSMIEVPNPISMARSFAISPTQLASGQQGRNKRSKSRVTTNAALRLSNPKNQKMRIHPA